MRPAFEFGTAVRVLRNVRNDGTYPGLPTGALLMRRGRVGYVRDVGTFLQDQIIYSVHFLEDGRMIGCREEELQLASDPWVPSRFEFRDRVRARIPLGVQGRVLVEKGTEGEILKVLRDAPGGVAYHVWFNGPHPLQVPETALEGHGVDDEAGATIDPESGNQSTKNTNES
jgi:nitrogen fixation protein NifZ